MASAYSYFSVVSDNPDVQKVTAAAVVGAVLLAVGAVVGRKISREADQLITPQRSTGWFNVADYILHSFTNYFDSLLGSKNRKFMPLIASIFFFLFAANLSSLIPGMPAITTTVWVNVALALVVFVYFNYLGIREHGAINYLKHFAGPLVFLAPLMFPLEIFSTVLRVLTLNLRLYWNMSADHIVLDIFTNLLPPVMPVVFLILGTFVSFMQAFIFTTLSMVYILLATQHEDH